MSLKTAISSIFCLMSDTPPVMQPRSLSNIYPDVALKRQLGVLPNLLDTGGKWSK
jgi:hypothetical protein